MNIMRDSSHRPWPLPSNHWIVRQSWRNLLFIHWPIPAEILRPHIPSTLEIDTYNSSAWLGVVVLVMEGIHPRGFPFLSLTPVFPEINVRTYVQHDGKPGVYFLSLDAGHWATYTIVKRWYRLPYKKAAVSFHREGQTFYCQSVRKEKSNPPVSFGVKYTPESEVYIPKEGSLDHWFSMRYCLFSTNKRSKIFCGEIHHPPWPLQKARAEISTNTLLTPYKMNDAEVQPIYHFSKGVDTLVWNIKMLN